MTHQNDAHLILVTDSVDHAVVADNDFTNGSVFEFGHHATRKREIS